MAKKAISGKPKAKVNQVPITYQGKVSVKLQKAGHTIKTIKTANSGTILLFLGLSRFLSGQFDSAAGYNNMRNYLPRYLGVGYQATPQPTDPLVYGLYNELNIGSRIELVSGNVQVDATNYTITVPFTATIPYDAVLNSPISELGLFSSAVCGDKNSMLARVTIPSMTGDNSGITLTPGTNLLVEWSIVIQNKM